MPRPRFTIRVALAFTAIATLLAWQYSIVYRRTSSAQTARVVFMREIKDKAWMDKIGCRPTEAPKFLRRVMGDQSYGIILLQPGCSNGELERMTALFPEAAVRRAPFAW